MSTAAAAGRQLVRREQRAARDPASVVGSTALPAASSGGEGEGGGGWEEESGRKGAAGARVWGLGKVGSGEPSTCVLLSPCSTILGDKIATLIDSHAALHVQAIDFRYGSACMYFFIQPGL
jgi:hypothetical protein